tara:strand:+ start:1233 stop:3596 length:2364 start_codon:yes stop_codon:yes gene_type:complete
MGWKSMGSAAVIALVATVQAHGAGGFERIATFANYTNNADIGDETVSEIVAATADGRMLVYTDSELEEIGLVDIEDPADPRPAGKIPVGGEPTSVAVLGNDLALVGVNTSESFTDTGGALVVVDLGSGVVVRSVDLGGQPDSVAISPDGRYVAIAIENERDEEICVGGALSGAPVPEDGPEEPGDVSEDACENAGGAVGVLPQTLPEIGNPPGYLAIVDTQSGWSLRTVDLTGLAGYAPEDPEPEFVDVNADNLAAVSLQENNHIVIVDLVDAAVVSHFSAGTVDLDAVDAVEDGAIALDDALSGVAREPDAVAWVPGACDGEDAIATANEGDLFGGSRGFTLFCQDGQVLYDSGNEFEAIAVAHGHYPEDRSENKGSEPEAVEFGSFGGDGYLFVGSERGSFVAVYRQVGSGVEFLQLLPAPLGPEGLLSVAGRNLLVVSGEEDDPAFGVRSTLMIYRLDDTAPGYPQIVSEAGIGWSALSGMVADPWAHDSLLAVWDSYYDVSNVFRIDVSEKPAVITEAVTLTGGRGDYDPEGIAVAPDGTWWIASEGDDPGARPNLLVQADSYGNVLREVGLPAEIEACRAASEEGGTLDNGFEGVAVLPTRRGYLLLAAQQLPWTYTTPECTALDDEPGFTRIWIYDPAYDKWSHVAYELAPVPENASWVGLSEITLGRGGDVVLIERDNRTGDFAALKTLVRVDLRDAVDGVVSADDKAVYDVVPALESGNGWISDKPEGLAIDRGNRLFLSTDNDGVEDWSGETWFLELGNYKRLFAPAAPPAKNPAEPR